MPPYTEQTGTDRESEIGRIYEVATDVRKRFVDIVSRLHPSPDKNAIQNAKVELGTEFNAYYAEGDYVVILLEHGQMERFNMGTMSLAGHDTSVRGGNVTDPNRSYHAVVSHIPLYSIDTGLDYLDKANVCVAPSEGKLDDNKIDELLGTIITTYKDTEAFLHRNIKVVQVPFERKLPGFKNVLRDWWDHAPRAWTEYAILFKEPGIGSKLVPPNATK